MNTRKLYKKSALRAIMVSGVFFGLTSGAMPILAADDGIDQTAESYYANPAQASHAAQLAEQFTMDDPGIQDALQDVDDAQTTVDELQAEIEAGDFENDVAEAAAIAELADAQQELENAEIAYAGLVAEVSGVTAANIQSMRSAGMGWGQIAQDLGVHPSTLGRGLGKNQDIATEPETAIDVSIDDPVADINTYQNRNQHRNQHRNQTIATQPVALDPVSVPDDPTATTARKYRHRLGQGAGQRRQGPDPMSLAPA